MFHTNFFSSALVTPLQTYTNKWLLPVLGQVCDLTIAPSLWGGVGKLVVVRNSSSVFFCSPLFQKTKQIKTKKDPFFCCTFTNKRDCQHGSYITQGPEPVSTLHVQKEALLSTFSNSSAAAVRGNSSPVLTGLGAKSLQLESVSCLCGICLLRTDKQWRGRVEGGGSVG